MKERIKSWTLTVLVGLSVFLTWQLWTFQPSLAPLNEASIATSEELGEELQLEEVVEPDQLILHDGDSHASLNATDALFSRFYEDLLDSRFENITLNQEVNEDDIYEGQRSAEIIYPTPVPDEIMEQMLRFEEDSPNLSMDSIDRIVLQDQGGDTDTLIVKFISHEESFVLEGETNFSLSAFREEYVLQMDDYTSVFPYQLNNNASTSEVLYLPTEAVTYNTLSDTSTEIDYNKFLNLLFSDSDYVEQYRQDNQNASFTDGNQMMSIEENGSYLTYVNPVYSENTSSSQSHVIGAAFDFVNSRGGWTDDYRLYDWHRQTQEESATYRMMVAGLPVFTAGGPEISSINVTRSGGQVSEYSRPLFQLDDSPIDARGSMELASGEEVVEYAEEQFDPSLIEDIKPGYQLEKTDSLVFRFEPSWYVKQDGAWYPIDPEETPGTQEG
ncbi:YycH family regulatory protein [Salibacterium aidingense]|uniref:YycH family regulatory protein n=1 Tax=Salibacterium aidingense TaxID=384933 RepID=UPI000404CD77|nr:two-component system activity regulator YycH [Salibacterium aidingense]